MKESITFAVREDLSVFIPHILESIFIEFVQGKKKNIVGIIYRPNTQPKADVDIFSATLLDIIGIINDEKKHCTLMGDFNLDLLKYNVHEKTTDFVDNIISHGFLPTIHKPTRVTTESATIIDHIYVNYATHKSKSLWDILSGG